MLPLNREFSHVARSMTRDLLGYISHDDFISFAGGAPDPTLLDTSGITECVRTVLDDSGPDVFQYSVTKGEPELRQAMAREMQRRHLPARADNILISTGSQEILFLLARVIINPGDTVLVEAPTYPAAIQAFTMTGARVIPVPCDDNGIIPSELERALRDYDPVITYLIPVFQNPTGRSMSERRKDEVRRVLADHRSLLVEDDAYSPLAFDGNAREPLSYTYESESGAVYLASLSKFLSPAFRIGAALLPNWLLQPMVVAKQVSTLHGSVIDQRAAALWLDRVEPDGVSSRDRALNTMRSTYQARCNALRTELLDIVPDGTHITDPDGGMFVWIDFPDELRPQVNTLSLIDDAIEHEIAFVPGTEFFPHDSQPTSVYRNVERKDSTTINADTKLEGQLSIRFSFAGNSIPVMKTGMERFATVLQEALR